MIICRIRIKITFEKKGKSLKTCRASFKEFVQSLLSGTSVISMPDKYGVALVQKPKLSDGP